MVTAIPPLQELENIEFGGAGNVREVVSPDGPKFIVASYNIRYAVGQFLISSGLLRKAGILGSRRRNSKVANHIHLAARAFSDAAILPRVDLLALQEADKRTQRAGWHHVARELAEELQMDWIHVPAGIPRGQKPEARQWWLNFEEQIGLYDAGDTGVALVSHLPLSDVTRIDLPWHECPWRPRLAMAATVSIGQHRLRIVNAHVDPHAGVDGQLEQLEMLIAEAESFNGPRMILGDFNTLSRRKAIETRNLLEAHGYSTPFPTGTPTWRGAGIRLHADWIFYRDLEITRWGVARPLKVSDHWPIWAEVRFI